jgi:hypothetical protein
MVLLDQTFTKCTMVILHPGLNQSPILPRLQKLMITIPVHAGVEWMIKTTTQRSDTLFVMARVEVSDFSSTYQLF